MEAIPLSFVKVLVSELGSQTAPYAKMVFCLGNEKTKFMNTLSTIESALTDLVMQNEMSHSASDWFEKLHDILYDADDLVDDFAAKALQNRLATRMKRVLHFYSTIQFYVVSAYRLKDMRDRLDAMAADRNKFHAIPMGLVVSSQEVRNKEREETHSFVYEPDVIGRNDDKKRIIELVMDSSSSSSSQENVSVIPIIGIGGVGKTTLAQLIYNDKEIEKHFNLKMWVCVSDNFDLKLIVAKIIESATGKPCESNALDQLQSCLRKEVDGKRYLLVLDDIWNDEREKWLKLRDLLMGGAKGSKVIITSRMELVATITSTVPPYVLASLPEDMSWSLFSKVAFRPGQELEKPWVVRVGKEIVRKCVGNPLAIRAVGGILYTKDTEDEWLSFKNNELSAMAQNENVKIQQIVKLSYDHLPSHLKSCFAYCSLFPKGYALNKDTLIQLWMAQGFIRSSNKDQCLEDAGDEYFMYLYRRSFFHDVRRDGHGHITSCCMHDLFHDCAVSVLGFEISLVNLDAGHVAERTRHVSFSSSLDSSWEFAAQWLNASKLRTFLLPVQSRTSNASSLICDTIVKRFRCLRVLDQHKLGIETVSSFIGDLTHLRFLDLSRNGFASLPMCITKLQFLQTLKLSNCRKLKELPVGISKLVNLRHLEIDGCKNLTHMPSGLGQLTSLRTLTDFVVSEDSFSSGLAGGLIELKGLNDLHGGLEIRVLKCLRRGRTEEESYLKAKEYLKSLRLVWGDHVDDHESLMEGLQPHPNLKSLRIEGYSGASFPSGMMVNIDLSLAHVVKIELIRCNRCQNLPPFGQLPSLQYLFLWTLNSVEYIANHYINDDEDETHSFPFSSRRIAASGQRSASVFPSLKQLTLSMMDNLEGWWWRRGIVLTATTSMPAKQKQPQQQDSLTAAIPNAESSSSFSSLPPSKCKSPVLDNNIGALPVEGLQFFTSLERLEILGCPRLLMFPGEGFIDFPSLRFLEIHNCESLAFLPRGMQHLETLEIISCNMLDLSGDNENHMQFQELRSLTSLTIEHAPKLVSLPAGLQHVTTLQSLRITMCANFTTLPDWTTSVQDLHISKCPNLKSIPPTLILVREHDLSI